MAGPLTSTTWAGPLSEHAERADGNERPREWDQGGTAAKNTLPGGKPRGLGPGLRQGRIPGAKGATRRTRKIPMRASNHAFPNRRRRSDRCPGETFF